MVSGWNAPLAGQLAEEFAFVHVILEGFAAVDEDDGHFVGELATQFIVAIHVDVLPAKTAAPLQLGESFLDDFAKMAAFARVNDDLARLRHGRSLAGLT
jgi:hypothetical protein